MEEAGLTEQEKDLILNQANQIQNEREMQHQNPDYPMPEEKQGVYPLFDKILKTKDTTKSSNLDPSELMAIRRLQGISEYTLIMDMNLVALYLASKKENVVGSALSKKGFSVNAIITNKREFKSSTNQGQSGGQKTKWFSKNVQE